ncbi:MAG TPA: DsrE family protein, partial [candidate division Zixibacteria bacterium]
EKVTIIINDPPYGTEKAWNAFRYAQALNSIHAEIHIFLLADAVLCAKQGQSNPPGYYNLEGMLKELIERGAKVKACGTCMRSRGIKSEELLEGVEVGKMLDLASWTRESQKVITF